MGNTRRTYFAPSIATILLLSACTQVGAEDGALARADREPITLGEDVTEPFVGESPDQTQHELPASTVVPPPALDPCDEPTFAGSTWIVAHRGSFQFRYFAGTAAERDLDAIAANRQRAYDEIRSILGIDESPVITVNLSPNRVAARYHRLGLGQAYPGRDRYDVVYTGDAEAYEALRYGHELTHVLAHYVMPTGYSMLPFLSEGLAEYLDQAPRDLHESYAEKLEAGVESRRHVVSFDGLDTVGDNYGRAGSFVQAFADAYGVAALVRLIRSTAVVRTGGCFQHDVEGCIGTPQALTRLMRRAVSEAAGASWSSFRSYWRSTMQDVRSYHSGAVVDPDRMEVVSLIQRADAAINAADAAAYRTTMEGFYCDWLDESQRVDLAARVVSSFGHVESTVHGVHYAGHKNYPTAVATVTRTEDGGRASSFLVSLERFAVGWRVTWTPDWR
jgi:hypothetical protein